MNKQTIMALANHHKAYYGYDGLDNAVICNVMGDFRMVCDIDDTSVTPGLINDGCWEPEITTWLWNHLMVSHTFIDVGANCGYFSILASHLGANVVAYEPNPRYVELIEANKTINEQYFRVRPVALSDTVGETKLYVPGSRHGDATIVEGFRQNTTEITIKTTTLDREIGQAGMGYNPYLMKVDVEGAEERVLNGAGALLNSDRDGTVMIEWTPGMYSDEFYERLQAWGDITYITDDGTEAVTSRDWLDAQDVWKMVIVRKRP